MVKERFYKTEVVPRCLTFKRPAGTSRGVYTTRKLWEVRIRKEDEPSVIGIGECAPLPDLSCDYGVDYEITLSKACLDLEQKGYKARSKTGKAVYGYVYAPTYKEAKRKRSQAIINIEANQTTICKVSETTMPTCFIRKLANDWMNSIQSQIKKSSYVKYYNILHTYILPEFDNVPLSELTSSRIQKFCDDLLTHGSSSGEGLSPKTVLDILSLVRSLLRYAQIQGYQPPSTGKEIIIRQTAPDTVVIPRSSQDILCRYLYANMSERNLGILLCLFTGMRVGEICALKWEDFSFQEKSIHARMWPW